MPQIPKQAALVLLLAFLAFSSGCLPAIASPAAPSLSLQSKQVVLFVLDGVTWEELRSPELPNMARFLQDAAVGLMNTKGPSDIDPTSVWVTLGAGRGAAAGMKELHVGASGTDAFLMPVLFMLQLAAANRDAATQAIPGLLGQTLGENLVSSGMPDRVLLRSDDSFDLSPALIADSLGRIPALVTFHTMVDLQQKTKKALAQNTTYTVISVGFPQGIATTSYPTHAPPSPQRMRVLREADTLLKEIMAAVQKEDLVILLSPSCPKFNSPNVRCLAPIAVKGPGYGTTVLTSPSTRRPGMVANVDVAPTILSFLDIPVPREMLGQPFQVKSSPAPLTAIDTWDRQIAVSYRLRLESGPIYGAVFAGCFVILLIVLLIAPAQARRYRSVYHGYLLVATASPLALFWTGVLPVERTSLHLLVTVLLAVGIAVVANHSVNSSRNRASLDSTRNKRRSRPAPDFIRSFGFICRITAIIFGIDMLAGAPIMVRSLLGSDPIVPGRFYGLGNHEAGVFISVFMLAAGVFMDSTTRFPSKIRFAIMGIALTVMSLSLGSTFGGADWGGGLSAAIAALTFWMLLTPKIPLSRRILIAILALLVFTGLVIVADLMQPVERQSHVALLAHSISQDGASAFWPVILRKAHLAIYCSLYSPLLLLGIPILGLVLVLPVRPPRKLRKVVAAHPAFAASITACGVGAVAASVLNDSGIVSGIAIICLPMFGLVYLALEAAGESSSC